MEITDFSLWDLREEFDIYDSAKLWFNIDPHAEYDEIPQEMKSNIKLMSSVLKEAIINERIKRENIILSNGVRRFEERLIHLMKISRKGLIQFAESINQKPSFLFPEERGKDIKTEQKIPAIDKKPVEFSHSPDFSYIKIDGEKIKTTPNSAKIIKVLCDNLHNANPGLRQDTILIETGISPSGEGKIIYSFRRMKEVWEKLVVSSDKGVYTLNITKDSFKNL